MKTLLVLSLLLGGCTTLATKSKFAGKPTVAPGTLVALTTTRISVPTGRGMEQDTLFAADSLFAKELTTRLAAATGWQVIYVGEARNFKKRYPTSGAFHLANPQYQLLIHAQLDPLQYGVQEGERRYEAWAKMYAWKFPENKWLGESHCNTLIGKPHSHHPTIEKAVSYSIAGLLPPWKKVAYR